MNVRTNRPLEMTDQKGLRFRFRLGHTHTTTNRTVDGLSIYTVAGTARAFDGNGCGYSVLTISKEAVEYEYVRHDSGPGLTPCSAGLVHPGEKQEEENASQFLFSSSFLDELPRQSLDRTEEELKKKRPFGVLLCCRL